MTLDNVVIRREQTANEVRVSANCVLKADRVSLINLDVQATGGIIEIERSFIGGTLLANPPRKPTLHLWKDAVWRAKGNWYDLESARVGPTSFAEAQFEAFCRVVAEESGSRWGAATEIEVQAAGIGHRNE